MEQTKKICRYARKSTKITEDQIYASQVSTKEHYRINISKITECSYDRTVKFTLAQNTIKIIYLGICTEISRSGVYTILKQVG